jgi:hypothetical protein
VDRFRTTGQKTVGERWCVDVLASTVTRMTIGLVHLLCAEKLGQHLLITSLAHRQSQFFAIQPNDLSTPTALNRLLVLLRDFLFIR